MLQNAKVVIPYEFPTKSREKERKTTIAHEIDLCIDLCVSYNRIRGILYLLLVGGRRRLIILHVLCSSTCTVLAKRKQWLRWQQ